MRYQLDNFILDAHQMTLHEKKSKQLVTRDDKVINALTLLVAHYPDLVTKEDLMRTLWPNQAVTEWSITRFISDLRKMLGPNHHIKTVHGRGYRYTFPIKELEEQTPATEASTAEIAQIPQPETGRAKRAAALSVTAIVCLLLAGASLFIVAGANHKQETASAPGDFPYAPTNLKPVIAVVPLYNPHVRYESTLAYTALISAGLRNATSARSVDMAAALNVWKPRKAMAPAPSLLPQYCRSLNCTDLIFIGMPDHTQGNTLEYIHLSRKGEYRSRHFTGTSPLLALDKLYRNLHQHLHLELEVTNSLKQLFHANHEATLLYGEALGALAENDHARALLLLRTLTRQYPGFVSAQALLASTRLMRDASHRNAVALPEINTISASPAQQLQWQTLSYRHQWLTGATDAGQQRVEQLLADTPQREFTLDWLNSELDRGVMLLAGQQQERALHLFREVKKASLRAQYYRLGTLATFCESESLGALGRQPEAEQAIAQAHALAERIHYQGNKSCTMDLHSSFRH